MQCPNNNLFVSGKGGLLPDAVEIFGSPFKEDVDREASLVWSMVSAMRDLDPLPTGTSSSADEIMEARLASSRAIVQTSKKYLEKTYLKFIQVCPYKGVPFQRCPKFFWSISADGSFFTFVYKFLI